MTEVLPKSVTRVGQRNRQLKHKFGITLIEFDARVEAQGGLCGLCAMQPATHCDHDHATGGVRAILCNNCNIGLGHFKDNPTILAKAIDYLENHGTCT